MIIPNLNVDSTDFVVQNRTQLVTEMEKWHARTLQLFLHRHDLPISGNKATRILRILDAIAIGRITLQTLQEWFYRVLKEGNRHIYLYDIVPQHVNVIKELVNFTSILRDNSIAPMNRLYQHVQDGLVFFEYESNGETITNVYLGYKERKVIKYPDYEEDTIISDTIDYHIFITIDILGNTMMINLDPLSGLREEDDTEARVSIMTIAERYKNIVGTVFGLRFEDTHEITQKALYQIWKDATQVHLPHVQRMIDEITESVAEFVRSQSGEDKLNLNQDSQSSLVKKIISNFEYAVIKERSDELEELISASRGNRPGFITEQNVRERTGGMLRQRSADRETPIEEGDTFGDTKITIDQLERVQKLHYTWHGVLGIAPDVIPTIIESAGFSFDQIIFTRYATLEEIAHVVSELKRYKNVIRASRGGRGQI